MIVPEVFNEVNELLDFLIKNSYVWRENSRLWLLMKNSWAFLKYKMLLQRLKEFRKFVEKKLKKLLEHFCKIEFIYYIFALRVII